MSSWSVPGHKDSQETAYEWEIFKVKYRKKALNDEDKDSFLCFFLLFFFVFLFYNVFFIASCLSWTVPGHDLLNNKKIEMRSCYTRKATIFLWGWQLLSNFSFFFSSFLVFCFLYIYFSFFPLMTQLIGACA